MNELEKKEVIQEYLRGASGHKIAADKLWSEFPTKEARRERMAVARYRRAIKREGKDKADTWMERWFGKEKARELLSKPEFKRQWIKDL